MPGLDADRAGRVLFDAYLGVLYRCVGREETQAGIEEDLLAVLDVLLTGVIGAAPRGAGLALALPDKVETRQGTLGSSPGGK